MLMYAKTWKYDYILKMDKNVSYKMFTFAWDVHFNICIVVRTVIVIFK